MKRNDLQKIITIDSGKSGPSVVLLAGIHGNEPAGILAFKELKKLKIIRGKIRLIYGNIRAIQRKKRFIDTDLNRLFRLKNQLTQKQINSYEYKRSREIMLLLDRTDILLDIHSTSKKTLPFIICGLNAANIVSYFPFSIRCYGFDKTYPGSTSYYMNTKNKIGIGIECGQHNDKLDVYRAINCVKILLSRLKMIRGKEYKIKNQKVYKASKIYITKTNKFKLVKDFKNFENVKRNQLIATDGDDNKIISQRNQFILFAKNRHRKSEEGFLYLK